MMVDSAIYEMSDLVRPIDTWRITYIKWQSAPWLFSGTVLNDEIPQSPDIPIDQAVSYPLWAGIPTWFEQEMGRPIALPEDAMTERLGQLRQGNWASDRAELWLAPGGFRCVK